MGKVEKVQEQTAQFTKETLCGCKQYANERDLLYALLQADKQYTLQQVDERIKDYKERLI